MTTTTTRVVSVVASAPVDIIEKRSNQGVVVGGKGDHFTAHDREIGSRTQQHIKRIMLQTPKRQ